MKALFFSIFVAFNSFAIEPLELIRNAENKMYHPKKKILKDLVISVQNPSITKQLNDQQIFGKIEKVSFEFFWTLEPLRLSIEVDGLPDGFKEIKENLKGSMISKFEYVYPISIDEKFKTYNFKMHATKPNTIVATDKTGVQAIPEFEIQYDNEPKLVAIIGKKPVGEQQTIFEYEKPTWANGQSVLVRQTSTSQDGPQITTSQATFQYQTVAGVGLVSQVKTKVGQKVVIAGQNKQENLFEEVLNFSNAKVNLGEAQKWFLAIGSK